MRFGASQNKRLDLWGCGNASLQLSNYFTFNAACWHLIVVLSRATSSIKLSIRVWSYVSLSRPIGLFQLPKRICICLLNYLIYASTHYPIETNPPTLQLFPCSEALSTVFTGPTA